MRSPRVKLCDRCHSNAAVLYRVQIDASKRWHFICDICLPDIKSENPHYAYGGTWKARKQR
jgi:protein-arginine kinase activator protein McsA